MVQSVDSRCCPQSDDSFDNRVQQVSICVSKERLSGQEMELISPDETELYPDPCMVSQSSLCSSSLADSSDATKGANKNQKQSWVAVYSDLVCFRFLAIVIGILVLVVVVTTATTMATEDKFVDSPTPAPVNKESTKMQFVTLMQTTCNNEIPHPPLPGKKGAAFTLRDEGQNGSWVTNLPKVIRLNPYWNYSWGSKRIAQQPYYIEFVPMIWGYYGAEGLGSTIANHILPQIQSGQAKRLLAFNEPDNPMQSNMPVEKALEAWPILQQTNLPLTSPSCQHPERQWMQQFATNVAEKCLRMEWVSVHWYGDAFAESFKRAMEQFHNLYQRPLLVTEFAPADWTATTVEDNKWTEAMVLNFMKGVIPWLETTPWIAGYAWFSFNTTSPAGTSSALFDQEGELTTCGRYYASITTDTPHGDMRIGTDQDPVFVQASLLPGKKGAVLSQRESDLTNLPKLSQLNLSWNRNWSLRRVRSQTDAVEFVPTLRNGWNMAKVTEELNAEVVPKIQNGLVQRLLGFYGPDRQSNMPVALALELWPALESLGIPLVSPTCFDPFGEWLEAFMAGVDLRGLRVDWIGVRWSGYPDFVTFQNEMHILHAKFQRPLLLTGMAPTTRYVGPSEMLTFMKKALPWLESTEYIRGYAWMPRPGTSSALFHSDDSTLTQLGRFYASVSPNWPEGDQSIQHFGSG